MDRHAYNHPDLLLVHSNANYRNKVWHTFHPTIYVMIYCHGWLNFGWNHSVSEFFCNIVIYNVEIFCYKEWQIFVSFWFIDSDTKWAVYNYYWARQMKLVTTNYNSWSCTISLLASWTLKPTSFHLSTTIHPLKDESMWPWFSSFIQVPHSSTTTL